MHVDASEVVHTRTANIQVSTYNREHSYLAIAATLVSFALLIFLLRIYTRIRLLRFFAIDDWLIVGAVVGLIAALASIIPVYRSDSQESEENAAFPNRTFGLHIWVCALSSTASITFIKTSIACFLLRTVKRRVYRRLLYIIVVIVASAGFAWFATVLLECIPIEATWDPMRRAEAHCLSYFTFINVTVFYIAIDAVTNLIFTILPMSVLWSSHHTLRNKLSAIPRIIITSLGLISTVAAIVRLIKLYDLRNTTSPFSHAAAVCILSVVEMTAGITAACLPTLNPLFTIVSGFFSKRRSSSKSSNHRHDAYSPPPSPYPQSYSTPTFLSLPRPKPARFHDHTSDLDFDLFEAPSTTRSRAHSRTPSNLTMFTTFTNFTSSFTVPPFDRELESARPRAHSKAMSDMEKPIELNAGRGKSGYAVSITSGCGSGETCEGSEEDKTIRRIGSDESCGVVGGGIMRTTEVRVS